MWLDIKELKTWKLPQQEWLLGCLGYPSAQRREHTQNSRKHQA